MCYNHRYREVRVTELYIRRFDELTAGELYDILQLRQQVFIIDQQCIYDDMDGCDKEALHVYLEDTEGIAAYLRIMDRNVKSEYVTIGRVVTAKRARRQGLASRLLDAAVQAAVDRFRADKVYIEAQTYARTLYEKQGFVQISEEFLEDGIPHIKMLLTIK